MYTVHCILLQWFLKLGPNWAQLKPTSALPPSPAPCCKAGKYNWKPEVDVEIQEPSLLQTLSLIIVHLALMKVHIDGYNRAEGHKQTHILWLLQQCRLQGSLCKVHTSQFTVHREHFTIHTVHSWENVQSAQELIPNAALGPVVVCPLLGMEPPPLSSPGHEYHVPFW